MYCHVFFGSQCTRTGCSQSCVLLLLVFFVMFKLQFHMVDYAHTSSAFACWILHSVMSYYQHIFIILTILILHLGYKTILVAPKGDPTWVVVPRLSKAQNIRLHNGMEFGMDCLFIFSESQKFAFFWFHHLCINRFVTGIWCHLLLCF